MTNNIISDRYKWIDWMKTIGMYFIVLGHFFTYGYKYVYVFSVPVFFIISGFLSKKETNSKLFWMKLWYNLIVPMFLICFIYFIFNSIEIPINHVFSLYRIKFYFVYSLLGFQSSLGTLWFVYTLAILKIIYQFSPNKLSSALLLAASLAGAYIYNNSYYIQNHSLFHNPNAITNILVAYPFFIIGVYLSKFKVIINTYNNLPSHIIGLLLCVTIIFICGHYNGGVWMYNVGYGNNILLFLIGGISGSIAVFIISKLLSDYSFNWVLLISKGSIIILGFHVYIIWYIRKVIPSPSYIDFILSLLILIAFIPLIFFSEKYCPILLGKFRK